MEVGLSFVPSEVGVACSVLGVDDSLSTGLPAIRDIKTT